MKKTLIDDNLLIPDRHPQKELFVCDVADAVLKDVMPHMEHPFYSLSKKPDLTIRRYEHNGNWIEIIPSVKGLATIYDKDILIYCISQIMATLKNNKPVSQFVKINSHDLLIFTNRGIGGKDYKALSESLDRLAGTRIKTNIRTGDEEQVSSFGLIDSTSIKRKHGFDGRLLNCEIKLSDWVFNAIKAQEVLTLHPAYFRLRKPIERRVYELARKHCGKQKQWSVSLSILYKKSGVKSTLRRFRQSINELHTHSHLPDYLVDIDSDKDTVIFVNRQAQQKANDTVFHRPSLKEETYKTARQAAPGYDIYWLEEEWINFWVDQGKPCLKNPNSAFIAFCKKRNQKNPIL
jgi:plasmid replication initiation protein